MTPNEASIKVPCEMAVFAFREHAVSQVGVFLASHFCYSGKAKNTSQIARNISELLPLGERQVRRHVNWLLDRDWLHKSHSEWYFFRSIDTVHRKEGWKFGRATKFNSNDLKQLKGYLAACVLTSLIETGIRGDRTVRLNRRTGTPIHPVSLSSVSQLLDCSERTAQRIVKEAERYNYIRTQENLSRIKGLLPITLKYLRQESIKTVRVNFFGSPDSKIVSIDRIRFVDSGLALQLPNLIQSNLKVKNRRGLNSYHPYRDNNGRQK